MLARELDGTTRCVSTDIHRNEWTDECEVLYRAVELHENSHADKTLYATTGCRAIEPFIHRAQGRGHQCANCKLTDEGDERAALADLKQIKASGSARRIDDAASDIEARQSYKQNLSAGSKKLMAFS